MRTNWEGNLTLQDRVHGVPGDARVMVEALAVVREDTKDTREEWAAADAVSGVNLLDDGGVKLGGSVGTAADHAVATGDTFNDLDTVEPFDVIEIQWDRFGGELQEIDRVTLRVNADVSGAGVEVTEWRAQLLRVHRDSTIGPDAIADRILELVAISAQAVVPHPTGPALQDIVFPFRSLLSGTSVVVGPPPVGGQEPVTVLMVWALKGQGEKAGNVALRGDAGTVNFQGTDYRISAKRYDVGDVPPGANRGGVYVDTLINPPGLPRVLVERVNYVQQTVAFTQAGNRLDLGAAPTAPVEVALQGQKFGDSVFTGELAVPGSGTWVAVQDGDLIGVDNTPQGGNDLTSLPLRQDYDARVTLTPGPSTFSGPIVRRIGVQERQATLFSDAVKVEGLRYSVDPVTLAGRMTTPTITFLRTGEVDYRDEVTRLFSDYHPRQLEFRVWVGHPSDPRATWLHIDSFLVEDHEDASAGVRVMCMDVMGEAQALVPAVINGERAPVVYATNLKAAYDDVMDGQIGVPARRRGPGIQDAVTAVSRTLREETGKTALDALAMIGGGTVIASQGRLVFRKMFTDADDPAPNPVAFISADALQVTGMTPGFRAKVPEYYVPYAYTEGDNGARGVFDGESRTFHAEALTKVGVATVERVYRAPGKVAEWIPAVALADTIGNRVVRTMGTGLLVATVRSIYPMPHLEVGDTVSIETDRLVVKDPLTDQPVRGNVILTGRITMVDGVWGTGFQVWVQSYANIIPGKEDIGRPGWGTPNVGAVTVNVDAGGMSSAILYGSRGVASWQWAVTVEDLTQADGEALALGPTSQVAPGPTARLDTVLQLEVGQTATVWAVGWSGPDATGTRTPAVRGYATFQSRGLGRAPDVQTRATAAGNTGTLVAEIKDPDLTLFREDGQDTGMGVFFETDPPDPSKPDNEATYVQVTNWTRTEDDGQRYTFDYDISGGAVVARVDVRYDNGAGIQHIYRSQLIEPDPLPEFLRAWADVQYDGQLMVAGEVDSDTILIYTAIRTDRPPTTAEILATTPQNAPAGGGFWYWADTGVFPDYGAKIFVGNIPTGAGGAPQGREVQRSYQRDHERPYIETVSHTVLPDLRPSVVIQGRGKATKTFYYAASKLAMPLDNPAAPYPTTEQPDPALNKPRSIVSGFHTHMGGTNPEFGNYVATLGWDARGNLRQDILGADGTRLTLDTPTDVIYIRVWPANAVQRWMPELNPPRTDVDHTRPGPPGTSETVEVGPYPMEPDGRVSLSQGIDTYGNGEFIFLGGRYARSVSFKVVDAGPYQPDLTTVIPDDVSQADGTLELEYEAPDIWEAFGAAYLPNIFSEGWTAFRAWWHFGPGGTGETVTGQTRAVFHENRSTARLLSDASQMVNPATPHLVNLFLRVVDGAGKAVRVRVWLNKGGLTDPVLTGDPDGYYDIVAGAGVVQLGPGTQFNLTGGGTDTLLANVTVRGTDGKIAGLELQTLDGGTPIGTTFVDEWNIGPQGSSVDENSNLRPDIIWTDGNPVQKTKDGGEKADDSLSAPGQLIDGIDYEGDAWIRPDKDIQVGSPGTPGERATKQGFSGSKVKGLVNIQARDGTCGGPVSWTTQNVYQEGSDEAVFNDGQRLTGLTFVYMVQNVGAGDTAGIRVELLRTDGGQVNTSLGVHEILYPGINPGVWYSYTIPLNHVVDPDSTYRIIVGFKAQLGSGSQVDKFRLIQWFPVYGKTGAFNTN